MSNRVRIMIVDDIAETRENIKRLVELEKDFEVVAEAQDGESAIHVAKKIQPDVILMDINLPGIDGLKASEVLSQELPETSIIMVSVQEEQYYMRQAMAAGARGYLMKPFSRDELVEAIRRVFNLEQKRRDFRVAVQEVRKAPGQVITVFSGKGGVGKTTISVNLASALATLTNEKVAVVDLDLQFGDVSLMMDVNAKVTIADLTQEIDTIDAERIEDYLLSHKSGVKILAAPNRPEEAELVRGHHIAKIIHTLRQNYRYLLIDTAPTFQEINLAALDQSDKIFVVSVLELATIKNIHLSLQIMEQLNYSAEKISLILNRADSEHGLTLKDMEKTLKLPVKVKIPSDGSVAVRALNTGEPFVLSSPKTPIAKSIFDICNEIEPELTQKNGSGGGFFGKMREILKK